MGKPNLIYVEERNCIINMDNIAYCSYDEQYFSNKEGDPPNPTLFLYTQTIGYVGYSLQFYGKNATDLWKCIKNLCKIKVEK